MRIEHHIALFQAATDALEIRAEYYEGTLSSGPYASRDAAEMALSKHFGDYPRDADTYVIVTAYRSAR